MRLSSFPKSFCVSCATPSAKSSLSAVTSKQCFLNHVVAKRSFSSSLPRRTSPIVEVREYSLKVQHASAFWKATNETAELRRTMVPLRFYSRPETGGKLHVATHAYYYQGGQEERDIRRQALEGSLEWQSFKYRTREFIAEQHSNIYVEAPFVNSEAFPQVKGLASTPDSKEKGLKASQRDSQREDSNDNPSILEIRRYQLLLGYDTVPKFLDLYTTGLPSKLGAPGTDPTTSLVTVMYSEVGRLNEVWEIWHHGQGYAAMEASRQAARKATEWKQAIANIAPLALTFHTTIHRPTAFSPLR